MHELSIVEALLNQCEEEAKKHKASLIDEIYIKIGRLSGVEVDLFTNTFETFKQNSALCEKSKLFVEVAELKISCKCGFEGILRENIFFCPKCEGKDLKIIEGEDLYLMKLCMS